MGSIIQTSTGYDALFFGIAGLLVLAVVAAWPRVVDGIRFRRYPLVESEHGNRHRLKTYLSSPYSLYAEGRRRFNDNVYRVTTADGDYLVFPNRYLDELKRIPDSEIDVLTYFKKVFEDQHTRLYPPLDQFEFMTSLISSKITRNLAQLNHGLTQAVNDAVKSEFPQCQEWTSVNVYSALLRVAAIVSGNLFVGPELCRDPQYLATAIGYTVDVIAGSMELKKYPNFFKYFVAAFSPKLAAVKKHRKDMAAFLRPVVEERIQMIRKGMKAPEDTLTWTIEEGERKGFSGLDFILNVQLYFIVLAVHNTTFSVTRLLYDLAARPDVTEAMRQEVRSVLDEDGIMTTKALFDMKLTDSLMKESQRLNPPFTSSFVRYTLKPITLVDGTYIPKNTFLSSSVGRNTYGYQDVMRNESFYPDPNKFDPYRFFNLRSDPEKADPIGYATREQYQFVSVNKESIAFGFGRHACPGRFFAANEIKLILARVLLEFDVRMPAGTPAGKAYPNLNQGFNSFPDPTKEIEMRSVGDK